MASIPLSSAAPNANDTIATVLVKRPLAARVLMNRRMHCMGCPIAPFESLAEACEAYGIDVEHLLQELETAGTMVEDTTPLRPANPSRVGDASR
jgi:hybrid cluster-associated redox disulfide protein